jgi:hypothetical protein
MLSGVSGPRLDFGQLDVSTAFLGIGENRGKIRMNGLLHRDKHFQPDSR